ncbi:MAG: AMP-binding protein, partial [Myxococcota bacterium]|nr:AMP-binding protein [Myxococcota bacterium]
MAAAHPGVRQLDLQAATEDDASLVPPDVIVAPTDVASLIYTSGTTGRPKGVLLTHANFASLVAALAPLFPLSAGDAVLSVLPLHHTFEFTCGLLLPLSRGARVVSLGELTADRFAHALRAVRPTAMVGVPALWQLLERRILQPFEAKGPMARAALDVATEATRWLSANVGVDVGRLLFGAVHVSMGGRVRWLISGGAALPDETKELFAGLGLPLVEGYGLTEAAPVLTVSRPSKRVERGVGQALPGVEVRIANADRDGVGEVIARGPNVMMGYTDGDMTRRTIDADGWLHTGDLGRMDAKGRLSIVGRSKDVVISATGENVYPVDVELRLGTVPHVTELAVVGVEVRGGERLACLAVPSRGADLPRTELNERARQSLRVAIDDLPLAQRPAIVHLYEAPLPRTATRKVKREEVRSIVQRMMAASARVDEAAAGGNDVRSAISAVRGVPAEEVTIDATLRGELGFDSLLMTELLEALETRFGAVDPERLQGCLTVADVEELVRGTAATAGRPRAASALPSGEPSLVLPPAVQELGKAFVGKVQDLFYGEVMKPRVYGRAHVPHNRNVLVVANHASHLDMGLVRHALGRYGEGMVSLAAQDYFFERGLKRAFFENLTNLRPIDRRASMRQAIRQASEVIEAGKTVLVFPEGTRSATGEIQEFRALIGHLSLVHGVDVLPVFLGGTHAAMPKGRKVPTRRDLVARMGP